MTDPQEESLITQHLKKFGASGPLVELPHKHESSHTIAHEKSETSNSRHLQPSAMSWLPWLVAVVAVSFAIGRMSSPHTEVSTPRSRTDVARPSNLPHEDSGQLLAQLLTASPSTSVSDASTSFYPWLPEATLSVAEAESLLSKFKGLTAGRKDPFRNPLARSMPLELPEQPLRPKPLSTPPLEPVAILPLMPPPTPGPAITPTPRPPVGARLIGVVEGADAIALVEISTAGTSERRRLKREEMLIDGYRLAEVTPRQIILHGSDHKVIGIPVGTQVMLPVLPASRSKELIWPNKAAFR